jgi:hypothetical protein
MNDERQAGAVASGNGHRRESAGRLAGSVPSLDNLQLFYGETDPALSRLYARLGGVAPGSNLKLSGAVSGPVCEYSHTLSATTRFMQRGAAPALLAEAVVADPCFWSPDLPMLYRVHVELSENGTLLAAADRWLGIRPLAASGRRLLNCGRNLVLRGCVRPHAETAAALSQWHAADAALWLDDPTDELLAEASRLGVWVLATATPTTLGRIARWPAVAVCVLPPDAELTDEQHHGARNVVLAQSIGPDEPLGPRPWCQVAVHCATSEDLLAERAAASPLPVIACRPDPSVLSAADVRGGCDRLQRGLAGRGEFAGYFV